MDSESQKTPQQELEELLRLAGASSPKKRSTEPRTRLIPRISLPKLPVGSTWIVLAAVGLVLTIGTVYLLARSFRGATGTVVIEANQPAVRVEVGGRDYGSVDSGFRLNLRPGEHVVLVSKEGFLDFTAKVLIAAKEERVLVADLLPIPESRQALQPGMEHVRLNDDGQEISFWNPQESRFQILKLDNELMIDLFQGSINGIAEVIWSPVNQAAIVQLRGVFELLNMIDNRNVRGRYVVLGESPPQAPALPNGTATWLFDEGRKSATGWRPVLLTENVRQVAFAADGSEIAYIYEAADGEYSLVRSLPDGQEWERVIVDMPRLKNPKLQWSDDPRYLIIDDGDTVLVADMLTKVLEQVMTDRVAAVGYAVSDLGNEVAYVGDDGGKPAIKVYDLLERETKIVPNFSADGIGKLVWLTSGHLLALRDDLTFYRIEYDTGMAQPVQFAGISFGTTIIDIEYSQRGRVLLIESEAGVFTMRL